MYLCPSLIFMKVKDFIRACLPGVWLEPVVSHAYYSHERQHFTKLLVNPISSTILSLFAHTRIILRSFY